MNEKFFSLPEEKRQAIVNAGYRVFSRNSYKKSPMSEIAGAAGICFGISAFTRKGSAGIGLGIAAVIYFLNLVANISESAGFLKCITPFGYAEGADIVTGGTLDAGMILPGLLYGAAGIGTAYWKYRKKDIQ